MAKHKIRFWLRGKSGNGHERRPAPSQTTIESSKSSLKNEKGSKQEQTTRNDMARQPNMSRMVQLSEKIRSETEKLDAYITATGLPQPSFDVDGPEDFPKLPRELEKARQEVIFATEELRTLALGPRQSVRWSVWNFLDTLSIEVINNYGIAKLVPMDAPIPLEELWKKTCLSRVNLARMLRYAMTNHVFQEPSPGLIAHTAASRLLATDPDLEAWVGFNGEDIFPAAASVLKSLRTYPGDTSATRTGFNFAFDTVDKEPMFMTFGREPAKAKRMGKAMASLTSGEGYEVDRFVNAYELADVDRRGGTFVDMGGSHGFMCVALARIWKNINFVVQDLAKTVESAPNPICDDEQVAARIKLEAHDFLTEQPLKGADVYYFRWIIHNYGTPYAVQILSKLVPALKPGARVVIDEHCLRAPGSENPWDNKLMRSMDLVMLAVLNAQERSEAEFRELFRAADERFAFKGVTRIEGSRMSVMEAVWEP